MICLIKEQIFIKKLMHVVEKKESRTKRYVKTYVKKNVTKIIIKRKYKNQEISRKGQIILRLYLDSHRERSSRERQELHEVTLLHLLEILENQKSTIPS